MLFIHPNFPGQFRRLATALSKEPGVRVYALGDESWMPTFDLPGIQRLSYSAPEPAGLDTHHYVQGFDAGVRRGQQVVRTLLPHKHKGFEPDVIYIHPGWGDGLYLKDIFPNTKIIGLFEYYYHARGADVGFDPEFPLTFDDIFRIRTLNTTQLHALDSCDIRLTPTNWQKSRYPPAYQPLLECLHEGIDTDQVRPDPAASYTLPNGALVRSGDEVLTYVSRSLEPYRGFHSLMRALPGIMRNRPDCQVIIVGQDEHHYGPAAAQAESWRVQYLNELSGQLDTNRLHFTGTLTFNEYLKVLQVSRVHVYLTYPFILSWSMLEAMSAGCLVLASDTQPVREFIKHGDNGMCFPFFDKNALIEHATNALAEPQAYQAMRQTARLDIQAHYDFNRTIYPKHLDLLHNMREQLESTHMTTTKTNKTKSRVKTQSIEILLKQASTRLDSLDYAGAAKLYHEVAQRAPNNAAAQMGLAIVYNHTGESGKALQILQTIWNAIQSGSAEQKTKLNKTTHAAVLAHIGLALHQLGQVEHALAFYQQAFNINPNEELKQRIAQLTSAGPAPFEQLLMQAQKYQANGQRKEAIESYQAALRLNPDSDRAQHGLGNALRESGDLQAALPLIQQAIIMQPGVAEYQNTLGMLFQQRGEFEKAVTFYRRALKLDPKYAAAFCNMGVALKNMNRAPDAIAAYRKALEINPNLPEAHNNLGNLLRAMGDLAGARASLEQALKLRSAYPDAQKNMKELLSLIESSAKKTTAKPAPKKTVTRPASKKISTAKNKTVAPEKLKKSPSISNPATKKTTAKQVPKKTSTQKGKVRGATATKPASKK